MGHFYETIPEKTLQWCLQQKMFWIATAPLSGNGHVNISPKGGPYFGIPNDHTFWYLDLSGSGNETIAHIYEPGNNRVTVMFNAFDGPPEIVRFWGTGRVLEFGSSEFDGWVEKHNVEVLPGTRSIIVVDIHQVGSSCGYSVPFYDFREHREVLNDLWKKRQRDYERGKSDEEPMPKYWAFKSAYSIDGLPGMKLGLAVGKARNIEPIKKMVGQWVPKNGTGPTVHTQHPISLVVLISFLLGIIAALYGLPLWTQMKHQIRHVPVYMRNVNSLR